MLMALGAFAHQGSMQQPAQTPQTPLLDDPLRESPNSFVWCMGRATA